MSITSLTVYDIRFPTSLSLDGSDAVHKAPDYSCAYVILEASDIKEKGHGFTFTCGRGTEIVITAIESYRNFVVGKSLTDIYNNFGQYWRSLKNEEQLRWIGPDKGAIHLALAAITNALWDLWAKIEGKPLWKLLADMSPEQLLSCVDFKHIATFRTDAITRDDALQILRDIEKTKAQREAEIRKNGVPAYVTSVGWLGYDEDKIRRLCQKALDDGWTRFKMKVGVSVEDDRRRAAIIRGVVGYDTKLMMDCNQVWDVQEAIDWMKQLAEFKPVWIEEPTSPDDVDGHLKVSEALNPLGIRVATGEHCANAVLFKQFISRGALQFCQIDACRVAGVNENIMIMLLARKYNVPVCPHAGGVGLCELVQHLAIFNYITVAPTWNDVMVEYADHLHEHFFDPARTSKGRYLCPTAPGYSAEMKPESIETYKFPDGSYWKQRQAEGGTK